MREVEATTVEATSGIEPVMEVLQTSPLAAWIRRLALPGTPHATATTSP